MLLEQKKIILSADELHHVCEHFGIHRANMYKIMSFESNSVKSQEIRAYAMKKFKLPVSTLYRNIPS